MADSVHLIQHPLADHHLVTLRSEATGNESFRASVRRLATFLAIEATSDLPTTEVDIQTPVASTRGRRIDASIAIVPILRAGLGMVDPLLDFVPWASVWHLGLYRDESTASPVGYYDKLPDSDPPDVALIVDPMLATGGSIDLVIGRLVQWGVADIRVASLIASQAGLNRITTAFPAVQIYVTAIDAQLNDQSYIVPGLGDAGDRIFAT